MTDDHANTTALQSSAGQLPTLAVQGKPPSPRPGCHKTPRAWPVRSNVWLLIIAVLALLTGCSNTSPGNQTALSQVNDAGFNLSRDMGTHYTGLLTTATQGTFQVDLKVTNSGSALGTLTQGTETLQYQAIDGETFIWASQAYWQLNGTDPRYAALYSKQWVKVPPDEFGIDVEQILAPANLGEELEQVSASQAGNFDTTTQINGVAARSISTPDGTVYVTTTEPYRVVRLDSPQAGSLLTGSSAFGAIALGAITPGQGFDNRGESPSLSEADSSKVRETRAQSNESSFQLFLQQLPIDEVGQLLDQLNTGVEQLREAIDSQVDFKLDFKGYLTPCGPTSCTVNVTVTNSITSPSSYVKFDPITADVLIDMYLDGILVEKCPEVKVSMKPNGQSPPVPCTASYSEPQDGRPHKVTALVLIEAEAVSSVDRDRMIEDLAKQTLGWRLREAGAYGLPGWSRNDGSYRFVPPKGYNPRQPLPQVKLGGETGFEDVDGAIWIQGPMHNQDYRDRGIYYEWDVQLTKQLKNSSKWSKVVPKEQKPNRDGYYHANIAPDGKPAR